jgi:hypothetical protein
LWFQKPRNILITRIITHNGIFKETLVYQYV